jgi:hypothetical protein
MPKQDKSEHHQQRIRLIVLPSETIFTVFVKIEEKKAHRVRTAIV